METWTKTCALPLLVNFEPHPFVAPRGPRAPKNGIHVCDTRDEPPRLAPPYKGRFPCTAEAGRNPFPQPSVPGSPQRAKKTNYTQHRWPFFYRASGPWFCHSVSCRLNSSCDKVLVPSKHLCGMLMPTHPRLPGIWGNLVPQAYLNHWLPTQNKSSGDIPNSMRSPAALAEPPGTLVERWWSPGGTLVEPYLRLGKRQKTLIPWVKFNIFTSHPMNMETSVRSAGQILAGAA